MEAEAVIQEAFVSPIDNKIFFRVLVNGEQYLLYQEFSVPDGVKPYEDLQRQCDIINGYRMVEGVGREDLPGWTPKKIKVVFEKSKESTEETK